MLLHLLQVYSYVVKVKSALGRACVHQDEKFSFMFFEENEDKK